MRAPSDRWSRIFDPLDRARAVKIFSLSTLLLSGLLSPGSSAQPTLTARLSSSDRLEIAWTNSASGLVLQESTDLVDPTAWKQAAEPVTVVGDLSSVALATFGKTRFFRLAPPLLTTIADSSPRNEERNVAVTRETILRLTAPLATNSVVSNNQFFAGFGGRRLLSRSEISSDRKTITLFYLEPLPGSARINVVFDSTGIKDQNGLPLDPDGDGLAGGAAVLAFETLNLTPLPGTAVIGRVFASELMPGSDTGTNAVNRPLENVTITVDGREETLRTKTDAQGYFKLEPVPPGKFFVHIDGRTAKGSTWPNGDYYPFVGKEWEAIAGRTNNPAGGTGEIFLPLVRTGTLQPVSATEETVITFPPSVIQANPALSGVTVTIPANSLYNDNGTRGGKVGIAPVPPDRLPGPLPPGLEPPIVITVQTDGPQNFDRPASICFPNLPDPVLGAPLPAGSKQELIVFNHDKGKWEASGSMHVSADGKFICTDPGVGILQPGWVACGSSPSGPPGPCLNCCPLAGGGGGPTASTLHSFAQPGSKCGCTDPDRQKNKMERCLNRAEQKFISCFIECILPRYFIDFSSPFGAPSVPLDGRRCGLRCGGESQDEKDRCRDANPCANSGGRWVGKSSESGAFHALLDQPSDPLLNQLDAFSQQIHELVYPYAVAEGQVPINVLTQVNDIRAQAEALVGGDVLDYLRRRLLQVEAAISVIDAEDRPEPGSPPAYPVLYAAMINRPNGPMLLRGETEPYGQYALFIPRDGTLQWVSFFDPKTKQYAQVYPLKNSDAPYQLPNFALRPVDATFSDFDHDGLVDVLEVLYGTDPSGTDSDGDGFSDGAEVENGTNPLDGQPTTIGVVATADTPGIAMDIWTGNHLALVADSSQGLAIFDISDSFNPVLIRQVPTRNSTTGVTSDGRWAAVTSGDPALAIIDLGNPLTAAVIHDVTFDAVPQSVAMANGQTYIGLLNGDLVAMETSTGAILGRVPHAQPITDLTIAGDQLYVLTTSKLFIYDLFKTDFRLLGSADVPNPFTTTSAGRLFVGGQFAYLSGLAGYSVVDVRNPAAPRVVGTPSTPQPAAQELAANGSGILSVVTTFSDLIQVLSLYDITSPANANGLLTSIDTPGKARGLSIYNGLAFVAAEESGLQVVNYLPYDSKTVPPSITLSANFPLNSGTVEEAEFLRVTANTSDDVQVRNVELYLDGTLAATDGGYPFEFRFQSPRIITNKTSFTLRARVTDTGGNSTWSDTVTVGISKDVTPPLIRSISPRYAAVAVDHVSVQWNEAISAASATTSTLQIFSAGTDGEPGTPDDQLMSGALVSLSADQTTLTSQFATRLAPGKYRLLVDSSIADLAGNPLGLDFVKDFQVLEAIFWTNPAGGDWNNPTNWSTGRVPGPDDDVLIATPLPGSIYHRDSLTRIKSLTLANPFILPSSSRLVITGPLTIANRFTVTGGTLEGAVIHIDPSVSNALLRVRSGVLDSVTLNADVTLQNGDSLIIANNLTLNARLMVAPSNGVSQITFNGQGIVRGQGEMVFGTAGANAVFGGFTIDSGVTLRAGSAILSGGAITNRGTIITDITNNTFTLQGRPFVNHGLVDVKSGSTFALLGTWKNAGAIRLTEATLSLGGVFTNTDIGTIQRNGGTVKINGVLENQGTLSLNENTGTWLLENGTIKGGRLTTSGGATLRTKSGWWDALTVESDLALQNGDSLVIRNGLTLNSRLAFPNGNAAAQISVENSTLTGNGQIVFGDTLASHIFGNLIIGPQITIRGAIGQMSSGAKTNEGTILAEGVGKTITLQGTPFVNRGIVQINQGATVLLLGGTWRNLGTVRLNQSTFNIGASLTTADIGTIERTGGSIKLSAALDNTGQTLTLNTQTGSWIMDGGASITGGIIASRDNATLDLRSGTWDSVTLDGDFTIGDARAISVVNTLNVNGRLTLASVSSAAQLSLAGGILGGSGQIIFGNTGVNVISSTSTLTIGPNLTVRGGVGTLTSSAALTNNGTIVADGTGATINVRGKPFTNNGTTQELNGGKILIAP